MVRTFVMATAALFLCGSLALAADDKNIVSGKVKQIDADKGVITLTITKKGEAPMEKEFMIGESVKFTVFDGGDKKEMSSKDGLKAPQLKEGATVRLTLDGDKVTAVQIGKKPK
ncbi:MAG: hypothetical protein ACJ8F7_17085 [Gemmataceae bacterium]